MRGLLFTLFRFHVRHRDFRRNGRSTSDKVDTITIEILGTRVRITLDEGLQLLHCIPPPLLLTPVRRPSITKL